MKIKTPYGDEMEIPKVVLERLRKRFGDQLESILEGEDFYPDTEIFYDEKIQEQLKGILSKEEAVFWANLIHGPIDGGYGVWDEYSFIDGNVQYTVLVSGYQEELNHRMTSFFVYKEPALPDTET